jgi:thiol:disulfide interchange protein DsbA
VEVLEFFAYSCGHCNAFEPMIDAWQKKLPRDVLFRRIPVAFRDELVIHQNLYFAIEAMGLVEQLHAKVFAALHVERRKLDTPDQIGTFVAAHGVDRVRFLQVLDSFGVVAKVKQATALVGGYAIEGTPSIGVNGRWLTSGSLAGSNAKSLSVAEYLLDLARKGR